MDMEGMEPLGMAAHRRFTVSVHGTLDFALTARVLRRAVQNRIDHVDERGEWSRVVALRRGPVLLRARQEGARLQAEVESASALDEPELASLRALIDRVFGLSLDLTPFFRSAHDDPAFSAMARRCAGLRPQRFPTLFEAFANALCCQQLSLESGLTTLGRVAERFGTHVVDGRDGVTRVGPPEAARLAEAEPSLLRGLGLSSRRGGYLRELARLPLDALEAELASLPVAQARRRLRELPGIGPWSADYVLLRGLGRLELFPGGDVGASRALSRIVGHEVPPRDAPALAARFAPQQGVLYFCMLGNALSTRLDPSGDDAAQP